MSKFAWLMMGGVFLLWTFAAAGQVNLENQFCEQKLGYCIRYPGNWRYAKQNEYTVIFSGREGTEAYRATVTIENIASTVIGGQYEDVQAVVDDYKCQLVSQSAAVCIDSTDYPQGNGYVAEFSHAGEAFRQWRLVVARTDGRVLHSWAFTAPVGLYPAYLPIAQAMLASWTLDGVQGAAKPPVSASDISVIFETRDRIVRLSTCNSDSDLSLGRCHSITYNLNITAPGYVALSLVFERGQQIRATLYDPAGQRVTFRPGNVTDVYTGAYAVSAGRYTIKVVPELFNAESEFELQVYFSTRAFSIDELVALYGPRNRFLKR